MKEKIKEIVEAKQTLDQIRKQMRKQIKATEEERLRDLLDKGQKAIVTLMLDIDTSKMYWQNDVVEADCEAKIQAMFDYIDKVDEKELEFWNTWGYGRRKQNIKCIILDEMYNNFDLEHTFSESFLIKLTTAWIKQTFYGDKAKTRFVYNIFRKGWTGFVDHWWSGDFREMIRKETRYY